METDSRRPHAQGIEGGLTLTSRISPDTAEQGKQPGNNLETKHADVFVKSYGANALQSRMVEIVTSKPRCPRRKSFAGKLNPSTIRDEFNVISQDAIFKMYRSQQQQQASKQEQQQEQQQQQQQEEEQQQQQQGVWRLPAVSARAKCDGEAANTIFSIRKSVLIFKRRRNKNQ
jgi:hypothetical protein